MEKKEILDVADLNKEFQNLNERLDLLSNRFIAIAMDYKEYVKNDFSDHKIYELRDSTLYRFSSAYTHIEILLRQHLIINQNLNNQAKEGIPIQRYFDKYQKEISSIFDSIIYHTTSIFDYISILVNYISGKNPQKTLMWNQLSKSVRDVNNEFSKMAFATTIDTIDRKYVSTLYDHRSFLIHRKSDLSTFNVTISYGKEQNINTVFLAGKNLIKSFSELRALNKTHNLTVKYATFWIVNKTIDNVTEILFALKTEMEKNPVQPEPFMFYLDPETNKKSSVSKMYWGKDE